MKKIIFLELCLLFLATTFQSDNSPGWFQQTIPRPDLTVSDLQFLDSLTGYILSSKTDTTFIFKTTDGGINWTTTKINISTSFSMYFMNANLGYLACYELPNTIVKKTTDGGQNWFTTSIIATYTLLRDIVFVNKDTGWVCSSDVFAGGLWRTVNGGVSWQMQMNENYNPSKIFFVNSSTGWVIGNSSTDLYKTTNCGVNWAFQAGFIACEDVFFPSLDTGWIIGGNSGNGISRTTNGGINWSEVHSPVIYSGAHLFFIDNKRGWVGNRPNNIVATKDGNNWGYQSSPLYTCYNISFADSLRGWAGIYGLIHTTDGGGAIISGVEYNSEILPGDFSLEQNYPNPFNPGTNIKYQVSKYSFISLIVYDITGREVTYLINKFVMPGSYEVTFDGSNYPGGVYFYRLIVSGAQNRTNHLFSTTKKMILVR